MITFPSCPDHDREMQPLSTERRIYRCVVDGQDYQRIGGRFMPVETEWEPWPWIKETR